MQISSPTQALNSPIEAPAQDNNYAGNVTGDSSFWGGYKAQKKNKPGIFAKLLEGLIGKGKYGPKSDGFVSNGNSEPDKSEAAGVLGFPGSEKTGENSLKAGINAKRIRNSGREFPVWPEISDGNNVSGSFSGFFRQDRLAEQGPKGPIQTGLRDQRSVKREFSLAGSPSGGGNPLGGRSPPGGITSKEDGNSVLFSGKERGNRVSGLSLHPEKGTFVSSEKPGGTRAKNTGSGNGPANVLSFSFREMEAEMLKSQLRSGQPKAENGEKENSRLTELRGKKGRDRLHSSLPIDVRDLRTAEGRDAVGANGVNSEVSKDAALNALRPVHADIELPVDLSFSQRGDEGAGGRTESGFSQGTGFEDALARELRGNLSTDIVRDASLIVRNGGEGTIRLSLQPASLGNVKIRLEMTENKITGHIIVQSNEALRAFERELPVLEKAFKDSGFSETNLNMSLASEGSADGWNSGAGQERQEGNYAALDPVQAASRYDAGTEREDSFIPDDPVLSSGRAKTPAGRKAVNLLI